MSETKLKRNEEIRSLYRHFRCEGLSKGDSLEAITKSAVNRMYWDLSEATIENIVEDIKYGLRGKK